MAQERPELRGPNDPRSSIATRLFLTVGVIVVLMLLFFLLGSGNSYLPRGG